MDDLKDMPPPPPLAPLMARPTVKANKGNMGKILLVILLAALGAGGYWLYGNGHLDNFLKEMKPSSSALTLAVGTFTDNGKTPETVKNIINDVFYSSLDETKKFCLVERKRTADIERENYRTQPDKAEDPSYGKTSQNKSFDENQNTVANNVLTKINKIIMKDGSSGKLVRNKDGKIEEILAIEPAELIKFKTLFNADYYLVGVISDFYSEQSVKESDSLGRRQRNSSVTITLYARLLNTKTGEILTAPSVTVEEPKIKATPGNSLADRLPKLEMEAARKAARKLSNGIVNVLYPISVSEVANGKVYLNRGTGMGVGAGDTFTVYSIGKEIIDPDTKKVIGHVEESVGEIVINDAQDKMSIAAPVSEGASAKIKQGMICRPTQTLPKNDVPGNGASLKQGEQPAPPPDDGRIPIAILPFKNSAKADPKAIDDLQTMFYTEMGRYSKKVRLIERQQMDAVAKELNLTEDGYVSPDTAVQVGKMTGAKYCLVGSLMRLAQTSRETALRPDLKMTLNKASLEFDCRYLETAKGEISKTATVSKEEEKEDSAEKMLSSVMRDAIKEACQKLEGENVPDSRGAAPAAPNTSDSQPSPQGNSAPAAPTQDPKVPGSFLVISPFAKPLATDDPEQKTPDALLQLLDSSVETAIVQTKRLPVVERQDDRFLDEIAFPRKADGFVDAKTKNQTGKSINAKYYLATKVLRYSDKHASGQDALLKNVYSNGRNVLFEVNAKLLEVETGRIVESFQFKKNAEVNYADTGSQTVKEKGLLDVHSRLSAEVGKELTAQLLKILFPVLIAKVTESNIYLNQGESTGIVPGDKYVVYKLGENVIDDTTKKVIGREETRIGTITVSRVNREMGFAVPDAPSKINEFAKGMECRVDKSAPQIPDSQQTPAPAPVSASPASANPESPQPQPTADKVEGEIPAGQEKVFALAPIENSAKSPNRAVKALRDGVVSGIKSGYKTTVVTRDEEQLAEIGREYLRGQSKFMDQATRLKALKLAGCGYMVYIDITDWVSQISTKKIPLTKESIDIQEVQMRVSGVVIELRTGKVKASCQAKASTQDEEVDKNMVVDGQGDLDKEAKIAAKTAQALVDEFKESNVLK